MKRQEYYKNEYMIGIYKAYQNDDSLIALVDNIDEFAEFMDIKRTNANVILNNCWNKKIEHIRWNGYLCDVVFINVND